MPATRRGVYHNLRESKYVASNTEVTLFFSSKFYLHKFLSEHKDHRKKVEQYFSKYIDTPFNYDLFADIQFYTMTEKRGFYAWIKGVNVSWQDLSEYALAKMISKNTKDWYAMQKLNLAERRKNME